MGVLFRIVLLIFGVMTLGCGRPDPAEEVMPSEKSYQCAGEILRNRYIVRFKSGQTKVIENSNRDDFKETFVRPNLSEIEYIEYDQKIEVQSVPEVRTSAIENWGVERVKADAAWRQGYYGKGVLIAVVDSGVDVHHPLLKNRLAWNEQELGLDARGRDKRYNGVDDDNNGYVDDYLGYDFLYNSPDVRDEVSHGTHVAGIIAAEHNEVEVLPNSVQGVAPQARILPLKFLGAFGGTLSGAISSLEYARKFKVDVVNASWGGSACSQALSDKIKDLNNDGIIFVVAAGNSGRNLDFYPEYPAVFTHPLQLTVGATGVLDGMTSFSNYSRRYVHLFAPGFDILSTFPNERVGKESGTSMATPFVSGALALLKSAKPHATPEEWVRTVLDSVAVHKNYQNQTQGRLDIEAALAHILAQ